MSPEPRYFVGWDQNGVARFELSDPKTFYQHRPGDGEMEPITMKFAVYNIDFLDQVLSDPEANFSDNDRALLKLAKISYPGANGPGGAGN